MWRHRCEGGLKKKLYIRSCSQRHRHFAGFFNVPILHRHAATLFMRWFRHIVQFSRLLRHAGDTEDVFSTKIPRVLTGCFASERESIKLPFRIPFASIVTFRDYKRLQKRISSGLKNFRGDEYRIFKECWIKRKRKRLTVGPQSLRGLFYNFWNACHTVITCTIKDV